MLNQVIFEKVECYKTEVLPILTPEYMDLNVHQLF